MQILAFDPGLAHFGYCAISLDDLEPYVTEFGTVTTELSDKKRNVLSVDDNYRRGTEVAVVIKRLIERDMTVAIGVEAMSFPRNSSSAAKMALTHGCVILAAIYCGAPVLQASPMEVKKFVTGSKTASKEEVQAAVALLYPEIVELREKVESSAPRKTKSGKLCKGKARAGAPELWEHSHDALAVGHLVLSSDVVKMARRMAG